MASDIPRAFDERDATNLLSVIADIREKSGLGAKPMLSELPDAVARALVEAKALGAEEMKERAMNAVREEQLSGDSDDDTDRAYERAINDALGAIRNLEAKDAG